MDPSSPLAGKRIVLSGGTTGLGRSIARTLAAHGGRLLIFGRNPEPLEQTLALIRESGGEAHGFTADVSKPEDVARVFQEADAQLGGVDILINNAGLGANNILNTPVEKWRAVIDVNLMGYLLCSREAVLRMQKGGGGHVLNIGSLCVKVLDSGADLYVATKTAVEGFTHSLRKEVADDGIKVTLLNPGAMASDMVVEPPEEQQAMIADGRMLDTAQVAEVVRFCLELPPQVDITELVVRPHQQSRLP